MKKILISSKSIFRTSTVDIFGKSTRAPSAPKIDDFVFPFQLYLQHVLSYAKPGDDIIDIGCGNVPVRAKRET